MVTKLSTEGVDVDWDDANHASGYEIAVWNDIISWTELPSGSITLACTGLDPVATIPVCTNSMATVGGLTDRYYYLYVRSRNASEASSWSSPVLVNFTVPDFGEVTVPDQTYAAGDAIAPLELPEGIGKDVPLTYSISPTLPAGLTFNASTPDDHGDADVCDVIDAVHVHGDGLGCGGPGQRHADVHYHGDRWPDAAGGPGAGVL